MVMIDDERRYVDANTPARLALSLSLDELRQLRLDDLTRPEWLPDLEALWSRFIDTGCAAGPFAVASTSGVRLDVNFFGLANALPALHLGAFVPAGWPDGELLGDIGRRQDDTGARLTPRELEVLELAGDGYSGPMIARELVVSSATVRSHFEHIYRKLGVSDRAAAVARAIRLGVIS